MKRTIFGLGILTLAFLFLTGCTKANSQKQSSPSSSSSNQSHKIVVTVDGVDYKATLNDSKASQSLLKQLPLELTFRNYAQGFDEKIADLDQTLEYGKETYDNDPEALDIGYWSPDQRLVFYYGDVEAYSGIHIIGKFRSQDAKATIQKLDSDAKVTIRLDD